ncbi:uncharacterized protein METZ01_LOCUS125926 [marine metagenome]|uniref:Uncharacterized protein n=1 Tax=marine metagenome TaxID=408172 RepID=A0A381Y8V5_9ZZZZ
MKHLENKTHLAGAQLRFSVFIQVGEILTQQVHRTAGR